MSSSADRKPGATKKTYSSRAAASAPATETQEKILPSMTQREKEDDEPELSVPQSRTETMLLDLHTMMTQMVDSIGSLSQRVSILEEGNALEAGDPISHTEVPSNKDDKNKETFIPSGRLQSKDKPPRRYSTLEDLASVGKAARRINFDESSEDNEFARDKGASDGQSEDAPRQSINFESKKAGKIFRDLKQSAEAASTQHVVVMREEKECHIMIDRFQLSKVAKAMRDIMDFQEEEGTVVRAQKVLPRHLKEHLRLVYDITHADLAKMDMSDLFQIIARETRVFSHTAFYKELKKSLAHVRIMDWQKVSAVNHETFYFQQLKLIDTFKRMLAIMLECNKRWCPKLDDKEYGLIKLFKSINDPNYVREVLGNMRSTNFKNMGEFFDEYSEVMLHHYHVSIASRELPYKVNQDHENRIQDYYDRKRQAAHAKKGSFQSNRYSNHRPRGHTSAHQLSHLTAIWSDSEDDPPGPYSDFEFSDSEENILPHANKQTNATTSSENEQHSESAGEEVTKPSADSPIDETEDMLAAMQQSQTAKPTGIRLHEKNDSRKM